MSSSQIKNGAFLSYLALFLSIAVTLVYTPFMLRMLGQAEYGLFSLVNTTIAYLTILDFGFGNAIVRYTAKYRAEKDKAKEESLHGMFLLLYIGIGLVAFMLAMILVFNVEGLFGASLTVEELATAKILMWLAAFNLALSFPFSVHASIITAYERFVFAKAMHLVRLVINPLSMVAVLIFGYKAVGMIIATTVLNIFFNGLNYYYCTKYLRVKMRFSKFDFPLLKEISIYSFFVFLNLIVDRLYWSTGHFLLGIFVGTVAVAVFAIGMQFISSLYIPFSMATSGLFLPRVTQISLKEAPESELSDLFIKVGRIQFFVLALILTGFTLYGRQFIRLWAGDEYAQSYMIVVILMVPLTIPLIQNLGISILQARNVHAFRSLTYLVIAIINVGISIPLIYRWGAVGCAVGTAISLTAGQIVIMNVYYHKRLKLEIVRFWLEICKATPAVILSLMMGLIVLQGVSAEYAPGLAVNVILYTGIYALIVYLLAMNMYEKKLVSEPIKRLFVKFGFSKG